MINPEMTFMKLPYKINVEDCGRDIIQKIQNELEEGPRKAHFLNIFELSVVAFAESIEIPDEISDVEAKKLMEIETTHPAFYNWLAYYLTMQSPNKISFVLDMYASEKYGPTDNFNNAVEFLLITCLGHVPFEHQAQDDAVVKWVREKNYPSEETISLSKEVKTIYLDATDAEIIEESKSEIETTQASQKESTPLFQDKDIMPNISITKQWQSNLCFIFIKYLEDEHIHRDTFINAMMGRHLNKEHRLFLNMKSNIFCQVIKELCVPGHLIISNKTLIAHWICSNFEFIVKGKRKPITKNYCISLLCTKKNEPSMQDRIKIDLTATYSFEDFNQINNSSQEGMV
jgi:hypothetical protein